MSSNIHHSTNTTNMWQGQKSFFFFLLSGKRPYTLCTDDWHLMKHKWLVIEHKQWEACLGLWSTGFLNSYNAATKKLLWSLSQVLTYWPWLGCWHSNESVNRGKFLSQTCNSLAFWEPTFFVGTNHLLSWKLRKKGTNTMSSACWIGFSSSHWVSTGAGIVRFLSVAWSHNHYDG